jgi:hypothetical protein
VIDPRAGRIVYRYFADVLLGACGGEGPTGRSCRIERGTGPGTQVRHRPRMDPRNSPATGVGATHRRGLAGGTASAVDARLRSYRPRRRSWRDWQRAETELRGLDYVEVRRLLLDQHCRPERKDALLLAFVRRALVDPDGVLCVAACLYPGLCRIVARYRDVLDCDDAWSVAAESLVGRLAAYDTERRRCFVALNLLRLTSRDMARIARRERRWREHVDLDDEVVLDAMWESVDETDPLTDAPCLSSLDAALIRATRIAGLPLADAAALLGLSYEAAKKRRQRAEAEWVSRRIDRVPPAASSLCGAA